ncbi:MAG TPA: glycosyltransferase family 1 protein [Candidatus Bathyarchaeia archaeon]|nr:glycosyltransferase family 1 protein [Candidatus Bathyarchaeia archaeon]
MTIEKLLLITDSWAPMMNGVVTTLQNTVDNLREVGIEVDVVHPYLYKTFPLPVYKDIGIPYGFKKNLIERLEKKNYDSVHIAVEGRLGWEARSWLNKNKLNYTTAFHTNFPVYLKTYYGLPEFISHSLYFRKFHSKSARIMVPTPGMQEYLHNTGYKNLVLWSRGVDTNIFNSESRTNPMVNSLYRVKNPLTENPYILYVGRISAEKNIEAFLNIKTNLTKILVGDGPDRKKLEAKYPDAKFVGVKRDKELAYFYANAKVFVFPSLSDTFGLVIIEALACGTPVAALIAPNTRDIITKEVGCVNHDLTNAVEVAITKNRNTCEKYVSDYYTWQACTMQFYSNLVKI